MTQTALPLPEMRSTLDLSRERMARVLDVSAKTIERWEQGAALPAHVRVRSRLARIQEVIALGLVVYTPDGFRAFLRTPLAEFDGRTALQLLEQDQADRVLAALAADYEGQGF
jgi:DNA-binding XRE family transcriptional regulator